MHAFSGLLFFVVLGKCLCIVFIDDNGNVV